jgi:hypothetical protein
MSEPFDTSHLFEIEHSKPPAFSGVMNGGGVAAKRKALAAAGLYGDEGEGRREGDFYPTPYAATRALIRSLTSQGAGPLFWPDFAEWAWREDACGEGHICRVLEERGVTEIYASDLADRGYGTPGVDFLKSGWPDGANPLRTGLITNPPYERFICPAFIRHAVVTLKARRVAMLLKATYWHADERQGLFADCPPAAIYPLTWRLDFTGAGSPAMETAWMVWDADAPASPWPRTCPLRRGDDTRDLFAQD